MITGLSKAVALYLAPLLALTSTVLSLLVFLAPSITLHTQVALLTVQSNAKDGATVWMGVIGELAYFVYFLGVLMLFRLVLACEHWCCCELYLT
jgi:hypothetical protein